MKNEFLNPLLTTNAFYLCNKSKYLQLLTYRSIHRFISGIAGLNGCLLRCSSLFGVDGVKHRRTNKNRKE